MDTGEQQKLQCVIVEVPRWCAIFDDDDRYPLGRGKSVLGHCLWHAAADNSHILLPTTPYGPQNELSILTCNIDMLQHAGMYLTMHCRLAWCVSL